VAGVPLYRLSKVWSINRESLRNHREKHISKAEVPLKLARVESNDPRRPTLDEVEELLAQGRRMYEAAAAVQNMPLSLKSAHLILAALELHPPHVAAASIFAPALREAGRAHGRACRRMIAGAIREQLDSAPS